ncbi:CHLP [Symbiodinium sp. CCMP2456]|nr:CHLP [Symbiodinium sp. CCMP2456]
MKAIVSRLAPWAEGWLGHQTCGGVPGRSTKDVVQQLITACSRGDTLVGQDLAKYFDSIDVRDVDVVLARLGAPAQLRGLVQAVYQEHYKLFSAGGLLGSSWSRVTRGLFQGCPLSPLLAASLLTAWSALVETTPGVATASFVDDRFLMVRPGADFRAASRSSDQFDVAFGFQCDKDKCRVGAPTARGWAQEVARFFGYDCGALFEVLGLSLDLDRGGLASLTGFSMARVCRRLRLVTVVAACFRARRSLLRRLEAQSLRNDFLFQVGCKTARDKARPLCLEVVGYDCETAALAAALAPVAQVFGAVNMVLQELGWWLGPDSCSLVRRDRLGCLRFFQFGSDGLCVLHEWLADWHRRAAAQTCGRLRRGYHRPEVGWASGVQFPAVAPGVLCTFAGHRGLYDQGDSYLRQLCLGYGCSAWDKALPQIRTAGGPADGRLAERLLAREVPERPAPPPTVDLADLEEEIAEALQAAWRAEVAEIFVATDGSSFADVASFAVILEHGGDFAGGVCGEDQSPYKAEVFGLAETSLQEATQAEAARTGPPGRAKALGLSSQSTQPPGSRGGKPRRSP